MRRMVSVALAMCLCTAALDAQQPLAIRRILLYKNGMAYLVRAGRIGTPLSLTFRPDEMNDVLKTFTAWNPDTLNLYPVGYTTGIAANEVLKRFPFDLRGADKGLAAFLQQVKGASIKLDLGGRSITGQLLAIVAENRAVQQQTVVADYRLTILTGGSVQSVWLSDVRSLEMQDPVLANQLKTYLQVLAEGQDVTREVTVYPDAAGGPVNVAYVQQFPVWKTTYRLDLNSDKSRIEGWAQIDNPTGESWNNVELTLVSGMPSSFTMDLYEPLYAVRSSMKVPSSIVVAPRQYEAALEEKESPGREFAAGRMEMDVAKKSGIGAGSGVAAGVLRPSAPQPMAAAPPPPPQQLADTSRIQDYFQFKFPFAIQLGSRQSALLPFLNKPIKADRVSIYKSGVDRDHPLSGAWLENNAEIPLDAGPVTFFQSGQYAGETVLDYLSRGERRLVSYGVDYDIQADTKVNSMPEVVSKITVSCGVVPFIREASQNTTYRFLNKGQEAKTLVLEHPRDGSRRLKDLKPDETTSTVYRFRIPLAAAKSVEFPVSEIISRQTAVSIRDLNRNNFDLTFAGTNIPADLRNRIENIIQERDRLADLQAQKSPLDNSIASIFNDQARVRENLKALGNGKEQLALRQKYLTQLDEQEQQVKDLRAKIEALDRQIAGQDALVSKMISELRWD